MWARMALTMEIYVDFDGQSVAFVFVFRLTWASCLAYPNLLGTKRLDCC
jgi:hypothetical protein